MSNFQRPGVIYTLLGIVIFSLALALWDRHRANVRLQEKLDEQEADCEKKIQTLKNRHQVVVDGIRNEHEEVVTGLNANIAKLHSIQEILIKSIYYLLGFLDEGMRYYQRHLRLKWFDQQRYAIYADRLEVNTKFVYPFLQYLGYPDHALLQDRTITFQADEKRITGAIDWVVYRFDRLQRTEPAFIILTVDPKRGIDRTSEEKARSLAYGLSVPIYVVTNGKQLRIYSRGVRPISPRINANVVDFPFLWATIVSELDPNRVVDFDN